MENETATAYDNGEEVLTINDVATDKDLIVECLNEMYSRFYDIYAEIEFGFFTKVVLVNTYDVYEFDKKHNTFHITNLPYNDEEDYILFNLNSVIDEVPDFTYSFVGEMLPLHKSIQFIILEKLKYRRKFDKLQEKRKNEFEIIDQGTEQV